MKFLSFTLDDESEFDGEEAINELVEKLFVKPKDFEEPKANGIGNKLNTFILFSIIRSHQHQEGGALSVWCGHSVCNSKVQRRK